MATLIVTPYTPRAGSGRGLRTVGVARALARSDDLEIAYVEFDGVGPAAELEADPRVTLRPLRASRGFGRGVAYARAQLVGTPHGYARGVSPELVDAVGPRSRFDRVIADGPTAAAALILVAGNDAVVYNSQNLESGYRSMLPSGSRSPRSLKGLQRFEQKLISRAVETWIPTRRELPEAAKLAPEASLRYVPNVVDVRSITPVSPKPGGDPRILFVADFTYEPNRSAARFLLDEVIPRLWEKLPHARLALVGRSLELPTGTDGRIEAMGFVDRLEDVYASADCAVVPLLEGGGSPLKLVEAMAFGLPVVATPLAASGLDRAVPGVHYFEAEGPQAFCDALSSVLTGGSVEMGRRGRALAEAEYSIEALVRLLA